MFDKKYKNAMDSITPDNDTREKILDSIILKEELKKHTSFTPTWRIAVACVACVALILGIVFVPKDIFNGKTANAPQTLSVSKSYGEIYKIIKPEERFGYKVKKVIKRGVTLFTDKIADDEEYYIIEEESAITNDGALNGNASINNGAARPGATTNDNAANVNGSAKPGATTSDKNFSNTTEQVEGVSEADIVKTDGEHIYYLSGNELSIFKAEGEKSTLVSKSTLDGEKYDLYGDMFLKDNRLILLQPNFTVDNTNYVSVVIYDVTNPGSPQKISTTRQEGWYNSSRMVGDYIYLISDCRINISEAKKDDPSTFVPVIGINGIFEPVPADSIYRYDQDSYENRYTVIGAYNYKDGAMSDTANLLGGTENVYCSQGNIILTKTEFNDGEDLPQDVDEFSQNNTTVSRLTINKGQIEYKTTGSVEGVLENQFYIDEHNGYFRFVTTVTTVKNIKRDFENDDSEVVYIIEEVDDTTARLTVLDSELEKVGEIKDLAKGERVYSVRFMGDTAYFVTFRQTDPLFSADLSDPKNPKILGELKIPGFSEYMYPYGKGLLLGFGMDADEKTGITGDLKLSMFNINDPKNVTEDDKTIIKDCSYSPALSNHKAMLVHVGKNLIGFAATEDYYNVKYMLYEYTGKGFNRKAELDIKGDYKNAMVDVRGLFIENQFYVISNEALQVFDINTFKQIANINF
ncbi:MAG: beta-propeller domain-containing protein [Clostridia bacterium]|nr:beta-propeller domain-containing protein [Clostridia bacterium]